MQNKKRFTYAGHVIFWLAFFWLSYSTQAAAKFFLKKIPGGNSSQPFLESVSEPSYIYIIIADILLKILMVYVCLNYLIPALIPKKRFRDFALLTSLLFLLTLGLSLGIEYWISEQYFVYEYFKRSNRFILTSSVFHLGLLSLSLGYAFSKNWYAAEMQKQKLQKASLEAELKVLKSQINPHFLFNTLNNIFAIARKYEDPRLADSLAKLSHLMRYMLYENSHEKVPLANEIAYINDFIELQRLRFPKEKNDSVSFEIRGDVQQQEIAPLLLLPFIENAFKFSPSLANPYRITLSLEVADHALIFRCYNTINPKYQEEKESESGIGLVNVQRRLQLLYSGAHELVLKNTGEAFCVMLTLDLS